MMNHKLKLLLGLFLAASLSGCATSYQAKSFSGGFSETMLAPDTFKINFAGNGFTSAERASDFAILRAADKSIALGCNFFSVMNEANSANVGSVSVGSAGWSGHNAWATSTTMPVVKPNTSLFVKCYPSQPGGVPSFDAKFIAQSVREKYGIKPESSAPSTPPRSSQGEPASLTSESAQQATAATAGGQYSAPPTTSGDIAATVLSAQKMSTSLGCGDVHSSGGTTFESSCSDHDVIIDCDGSTCRPIRSVRR